MPLPPELAFVFDETSSVYHKTKVTHCETVAENTLALTIEKPRDFVFEPGQNALVSIPGTVENDLREFSIASAPYEKDIMIAMRLRNSSFKKACYALRPGDPIILRTPAGALWRETSRPQIWLSGGIGITPFRSILRESIYKGGPFPIVHIHSDRTRATTPFLSEFETCSKENPDLYTFILTLTRERSLGHETGRIDKKMIAACAPHFLDRDCTIAGTTPFVAEMRTALIKLGVPTTQIRTERFEGYTAGI